MVFLSNFGLQFLHRYFHNHYHHFMLLDVFLMQNMKKTYWNSAANKSRSTVNYRQSFAFDCTYLSCNDHCDWWLFQETFFCYYYFYFPEILLNDLKLVFLEVKHIYKKQRTSLFSFYLPIFYLLFFNHSVY